MAVRSDGGAGRRSAQCSGALSYLYHPKHQSGVNLTPIPIALYCEAPRSGALSCSGPSAVKEASFPFHENVFIF